MSKVSTVWFPDHQRALAIGLGSLATPFGAIVGMGLGPFFVPDSDTGDMSEVLDDISNMLWIMAIATSVCCTPIILFTRQRPISYPS